MSGSRDKTIQLWDAETGEMLQPPLEGHEGEVLAVAFSPDGKHIVSGSSDNTIRLWDAKTGEMLQPPLEGHKSWVQAVAFSPDGKHIMSGSSDDTIRLWDAETREMLQPPLEGKKQFLICFSPHLEHALIDVVELLHDITPLSQYKLMDLIKVSSSGWVHIGSANKLLLWIPPFYHPYWYSPGTQIIIPVPDTLLDLSNMAHGSSWELCYSKRK